MAKLRTKDIQKVIQIFDNEMLLIQRVSKIEKMKMRKKVVNIVQPALTSATMTPETFMLEVETKLSHSYKQIYRQLWFSQQGARDRSQTA